MKKEPLPGTIVEIKTPSEIYKGIIIESHDKSLTLLKQDDGYNIGIEKSEIKSIKERGRIKPQKLKSFVNSKSKKKVALILTGGTISSKVDYKTGAVSPIKNPEEIYNNISGIKELAQLQISTPFNIDSSDIRPEHFTKLAKEVEKFLKKKDIEGIVIAHGTDTLHYTSAALSFMLEKINKPVILTYSQRSIDRGSSDAFLNLKAAIKMALSDMAEVLVVGHSSINDDYCIAIRGTKVRKLHSSRRDAFKPINDLPIAEIKDKVKFLTENYNKKNKEKPEIRTKLEENISIIKIHPLLTPKDFESSCKSKKAVIIEAYGLGQIPQPLIKIIKKLSKNVLFFITTQTIFGNVNENVYSNARELAIAGAIFLQDMLSETALTKAMYVLGKTTDKGEVIKLMLTNLKHEFNTKLQKEAFI